LKADLREAGFAIEPDRGKGSHARWVHRRFREIGVTLSGHDGDDAQHYQERQVREAIALARARRR
jgi:hypothetical protein